MALTLGSCGLFPPIGDLETRRLSVEWATPIYELEPFAYHAVEEGQPLYLRSMATPVAGLVVVPSKDRYVRGLDAGSGRIVWELKTGGPNAARPIAVGSEDVVFGSMDGHVYRVNVRNGLPKWVSAQPASAVTASPSLYLGPTGSPDDDKATVFVTAIDGRVTALDLAAGKQRWEQQRPIETELSVTGQAGATVFGDSVITGFADGMVVAYAVEDGATLWSSPLGGDKKEFVDVDTTPLVVGSGKDALVVVGSFKRGLFGLAAARGDVQWSIKGEGFLTGAVGDDGVVFVPQANGRVWAVEGDTGKVRWIADLDSSWAGTPVLSQNYALVPAGSGLAVLDRGSGREHVRWTDGRSVRATPELAYGSAYLVASSGLVYALGIY
ncbi:MAG: PQQ-binding-like beta-propeller repeat protein [Myxococcota bacterium]